MTTVEALIGHRSLLTPGRGSRGRKVRNVAATMLITLAFLVALVPIVAVVMYVFERGADQLSWAFLTDPIPIDRAVGPGMGPAVVGTFLITGAAALMAIPVGILGGIYLNEYGGKNWLSRFIGFMADVMTGVPSIVMGLFIFSIWVLHFGFSGLAGAFALGCLMLPVVIRSTDEMLKVVPDSLREGSYALGATKARVTLTVVVPAALGGIVSGALLAVARAAGETAPLLFTILTVTTANPNLFTGANTSLPSQIFVNASAPYAGAQGRGWGAALTLIAIAFILMIAARLVTARFARYAR